MLGHLSRKRRSLQQLFPLASSYAMLQQTRSSMRLFEVFSKERRAERKKKLKEEMERGYFDDFRDFRDKKGKIFMASHRLIPASQAQPFPSISTLLPDASPASFPPATSSSTGSPTAALVCVAFRAGAQEMLESWAVPFSQQFKDRPGFVICEVSLVESVVMSVWPFKQAILKGGSKGQDKYQLPVNYLYHFGNTDELRRVLFMTNRLTGYVYLVDSQGRVRWRGSGSPDKTELQDLLRCAEDLLSQQASNSMGVSSSGGSSSSSSPSSDPQPPPQ